MVLRRKKRPIPSASRLRKAPQKAVQNQYKPAQNRMSEADICILFVQMVNASRWKTLFDFFHVANERATTIQTGKLFKSMGVKAGIPDYVFLNKEGEIFFLEAKSMLGRLSSEQKVFKERCYDSDIPHEVFRTPEEGLELLKKWGLIY